MEATFDQIIDQLDLCAALMSDPGTMHRQPYIIAGQFTVALRKIEALRVYLKEKADKDKEKCKCSVPWVDGSILDAGIKRMVTLVMERHMLPLTKNFKFPKIFERELYFDGLPDHSAGENLVEREIKESNCLGAMVVLYYYLYWHIMLIQINKTNRPCDCPDVDDEWLWNVQASLKNRLPGVGDLLEYRHHGGKEKHEGVDSEGKGNDDAGTGSDAKGTEDDTDKGPGPDGTGGGTTMGSVYKNNSDVQVRFNAKANDKIVKNNRGIMIDISEKSEINHKVQHRRKTAVIKTYRKVLKHILNDKEQNVQTYLTCLSASSVLYHVKLFNGVLSSFNLSDELEKWNDMYKSIQIQSNPRGENNIEVYSYKLVDVLKSPPYCNNKTDFVHRATQAAIFDYCSVPLMVDISKALISIASVVHASEEHREQQILSFLKTCVGSDPNLFYDHASDTLSTMKEKLYQESDTPPLEPFHHTKFVDKVLSWYKVPCHLKGTTKWLEEGLTMDHLAGKYWGAKYGALNQYNHQYFALPQLDTDADMDGLSFSKLVFQLMTRPFSIYNLTYFYVQNFLRNSLFVDSSCQTGLKLLECLKCHMIQHYSEKYVKHKDETIDPLDIFSQDDFGCFVRKAGDEHISYESRNFIDIFVKTQIPASESAGALKSDDKKRSADSHIEHSISNVSDLLKIEHKVLQDYFDLVKKKQFDAYPAFSWPCYYDKAEKDPTKQVSNNYHLFTRIRSVPVKFPSIQESVALIADTRGTDLISELRRTLLPRKEEKKTNSTQK